MANISIRYQIAQKVRSWRLKRGYTQKDLAEKIGVTYQIVLQYEKGTRKISIEKLYAMAEILSINIKDLIPVSNEKICLEDEGEEILNLVREYKKINDQELRKIFCLLTKFVQISEKSSKKTERIKIAKGLVKEGISVDIVAKTIGLSADECVEEKVGSIYCQIGKKKYLLQGLVVCQNCGYAYSGAQCGVEGKKFSYYRCSSTIRITDDREKCTNKLVRTDMLETAIWEKVKNLLKNPEIIKNEYHRRIAENKNDESSDKKFARRENQIKQGIEKLMEDYYSQENVGDKGYISEEEFKQTMKGMRERLRGIEEEKKKVVDQKAIEKGMNLIINSIKSLYSSVKSNLEQLDWQTKRGIIKALVERIQIGYDQVEVAFRIEEPAQDGEIFNLQHCTGRHDKGAGEGCQGSFSFHPMRCQKFVMQEIP